MSKRLEQWPSGETTAGVRELTQHGFDQEIEQVLLIIDVPVERHRRDADSSGDRSHRYRTEALFVGDRERAGYHVVACEP
jgi:hypothetical protein